MMTRKSGLIFFILIICLQAQAQTWSSVGGTQGFDGGVYSLAVDDVNDVLYAGGVFKTVDGVTVNGVAKWDGTQWSALGSGFTSTNAVVYSLAIFQNELYAGGYFTQSGSTTVKGIAKWNGTNWIEIGGGITSSGFYDFVNAMEVFNGELYVGGEFGSLGSSTIDNVAKWNGTSWSTVGGGIQSGTSGRVNDFHVYKNELYIGGHFFANDVTQDFQYRIARLTGNGWVNLGNKGLGDATANWNVRSMVTYEDTLFAGGDFNVLDDGPITANNIARWDGNAWSAVGSSSNVGVSGAPAGFPPIRALVVYNDVLFVGGNFTAAGGVQSAKLASWDGATWSSITGSNLNGEITSMVLYKGSLVLAGNFTEAGGATRNRIALFTITTDVPAVSHENVFVVKPNPFTETAELIFTKSIAGDPVSLRIYDISGKLVKTLHQVENNRILISKDQMNPGMYSYILESKSGLSGNGRILVQ